MTTPSVSDILHDGRPRNDVDVNTAYNRFLSWITDGTYDLTVNSLTSGTYNNLPGFDISGIIAGENITKGNFVYLKTADGKAWHANSSALSTLTNILGAAKEDYSTGETVTIATDKFTAYSGLTANTDYFISTTGAISSTPGIYPYRIGFAQNTTTLIIDLFNRKYRKFFDTTKGIDDTDSPYSIGFENIIYANAASGAITINLPTSAGIAGRKIKVIKTDSSSNAVTLDGYSSETINGNLTVGIYSQYNYLALVSDGTNWLVIDRYTKKVFNIGDWNMDTTNSIDVLHGIADFTKIKNIDVHIIKDDSTERWALEGGSDAGGGGGHIGLRSTDVRLVRIIGGSFDSVDYDSTSFNRGVISLSLKIA